MTTNCLDLMDLLNLNQIETNNYLLDNKFLTLKNPSRNTSFAPSNKTISTRLYSQTSSRKQTQETGYRSIAYSLHITRTQELKSRSRSNQKSLSFTLNMEQMQNSFQKMESKMNKFQLTKPETIDQKYMITGFVQMNKDYQIILQIIKKYRQDLNSILLSSSNNNYEDQEFQVDSYFLKNKEILTVKVQEYYYIKESYYRFLRMGIQEPYNQRVQKKIELLEKQNFQFEFLQIFLDFFKFIDQNAFEYFKKKLNIIHSLQQSPQEVNFSELFQQKVQEFQSKLLLISSNNEVEILKKVFQNKLDQIQNWIQLILKMANFKYVYYIKYQLVSKSQIKKIIKSKKLYDNLIKLLEEAEQFQNYRFNLNMLYKEEIQKFVCEFDQIKIQIFQWNIHLKEDNLCQQVLILVKLNIKLQRVIKTLELLNSLKESNNYDQLHKSEEVNIVNNLIFLLKHNFQTIQQIKETPEIRNDEYIQQQYNKYIVLKDYFNNLQNDVQ